MIGPVYLAQWQHQWQQTEQVALRKRNEPLAAIARQAIETAQRELTRFPAANDDDKGAGLRLV